MKGKSEVLKRLKNGESKSELYTELHGNMDDNLLRRVLASRPPASNIQTKYRNLHKIICWIWGLLVALELLGSIDFLIHFDIKLLISLIISIYLLIQLWKFNADVYLPAIFWLIWEIFNALKDVVNLTSIDPDYEYLVTFSSIYVVIILITIILMYNVRKNVFSYYNWFKPDKDHNDKIMFQAYKNYTYHPLKPHL